MSKLDDLQTRIKDKANSEVQAAIRQFVLELEKLIKDLFGGYITLHSPETIQILERYINKKANKKWPRAMWTNREAKLEEELMREMNTMQRLLAHKTREDDEEFKPDETG